jgi:CheY-like chemotaxis protein
MASSSVGKAQLQPHILLVDDNRSGLAARRMVLDELGYRTQGTTSPREALKVFEASLETETPVALVITDFKMPEINGIDLIQKLRALKADVSVILVSGFVDSLGLTEITTGANAVIMKSSNEVPHLIRAVNRILGTKARRKPPVRAGATTRARKSGTTNS